MVVERAFVWCSLLGRFINHLLFLLTEDEGLFGGSMKALLFTVLLGHFSLLTRLLVTDGIL